ncbi:MAG: hypothetical protein AB8G14_07385 [Ilumatobacter sp.]
MSATGLDEQMTELFGFQCVDAALLVRRAHIIASLGLVLIGSIVLGVIIANLVVAIATTTLLIAASSLFSDRRILAIADGSVVQAKCAPFGRRPTHPLAPLTASDLGERPFGSSDNFMLSIHGTVFVGQRGSGDFAAAYRSLRTREH